PSTSRPLPPRRSTALTAPPARSMASQAVSRSSTAAPTARSTQRLAPMSRFAAQFRRRSVLRGGSSAIHRAAEEDPNLTPRRRALLTPLAALLTVAFGLGACTGKIGDREPGADAATATGSPSGGQGGGGSLGAGGDVIHLSSGAGGAQ